MSIERRIEAAAEKLFVDPLAFVTQMQKFTANGTLRTRVAGEYAKFAQGFVAPLMAHGMSQEDAADLTRERALAAFFFLGWEMGRIDERLQVADLETILKTLEA